MVNGRRYLDDFETDYVDERAALRARNAVDATITAEPDAEVSA